MNKALPFVSAKAGCTIKSHTSGFIEAYSSSTTYARDTPRNVSGLSEPFSLIVRPLMSLRVAVFSKALSITSCPISFNRFHIISFAWPKVGAIYQVSLFLRLIPNSLTSLRATVAYGLAAALLTIQPMSVSSLNFWPPLNLPLCSPVTPACSMTARMGV